MNKQLFLSIILSFLNLMACRDKDPLPLTNPSKVIFPAATTDTLIYLPAGNINLPVVMNIPNADSHPLPAVIVMHGSGGMWKNDIPGSEMTSQFIRWKEIFDDECVISVFVDSYSPRGVTENEGEYKLPPKTFEISAQFVRPGDAFAALEYLLRLVNEDGASLVQESKVGLLGFSHGGTATECAIFNYEQIPENWVWRQSFDGIVYDVFPPVEKSGNLRFAAAVAYYPGSYHNGYFGSVCNENGSFYLNSSPMLIHLATDDPLTENSLCFINTVTSNGGSIEYFLYAEAGHSFDGKASGVDSDASELAGTRTIEWFREYLNF